MSNVRPLHQLQAPIIWQNLLPTIQATNTASGQVFAWHPQYREVIQVFDSVSAFMYGGQSDLVLPFPERLINPVSGVPALHHYVETIRKYQERPQ
jgi:hypothetical protein